MSPRTRRWSVWPVLALAAAVVASACGGGGDGSGEGVASANGNGKNNNNNKKAAAKQKTDPQQAGLEFARCMREHGADVPDPTPGEEGFAIRFGEAPTGSASGPGGETAVTLDGEAFHACKHILDDAFGEGAGPTDPEAADRALKFAQCMREHGVNMPDPEVNGGMVRIQIGEGMDPNSPTLQEAHKACEHLFGPPGGAGGAGGGAGGSAGIAPAPGRRA